MNIFSKDPPSQLLILQISWLIAYRFLYGYYSSRKPTLYSITSSFTFSTKHRSSSTSSLVVLHYKSPSTLSQTLWLKRCLCQTIPNQTFSIHICHKLRGIHYLNPRRGNFFRGQRAKVRRTPEKTRIVADAFNRRRGTMLGSLPDRLEEEARAERSEREVASQEEASRGPTVSF